MLEHPAFRPKVGQRYIRIVLLLTFLQLFAAGNVPNAGQEEPFPEPDNVSKMRRSVENAEHVGLYIPSHYTPPSPCPAPRGGRRRPAPHHGGRVGYEGRRRGVYLPPARAAIPDMQETVASPNYPSPTRGRVRASRAPVFVNVNSPYDPFAGRSS
jgi:hypothetical protein